MFKRIWCLLFGHEYSPSTTKVDVVVANFFVDRSVIAWFSCSCYRCGAVLKEKETYSSYRLRIAIDWLKERAVKEYKYELENPSKPILFGLDRGGPNLDLSTPCKPLKKSSKRSKKSST